MLSIVGQVQYMDWIIIGKQKFDEQAVLLVMDEIDITTSMARLGLDRDIRFLPTNQNKCSSRKY